MATLKIDLRSGFEGDTVVVHIADREVYNKPGVRTRPQTGLADSFEVEVDPTSVLIQAEVRERGLSTSRTVSAQTTPNLGVEVIQGRLTFTEPREESGYFGYL